MTKINNNTPPYAEEITLNPETEQIQEILNKFKQLIPNNFVELEPQEGNCCGSTNPKWKNKLLSERYGFDYQGEWTQIDIPHDLMEKLELKKGQDITQTVYLDSKVLEKKPSYGGITIENEEEIILIDPKKR